MKLLDFEEFIIGNQMSLNTDGHSSRLDVSGRDAVRDGVAVPTILPEEKDANAVKAGKIGGLKGGKARAKAAPSKKRKKVTRKAA